jgi:hypothetical protein
MMISATEPTNGMKNARAAEIDVAEFRAEVTHSVGWVTRGGSRWREAP